MILYHGSNTIVQQPEILPNLRALDFGAGFYLTSNAKQAEQWAKVVTKRRRSGSATLNLYQFEPKQCAELNVLVFDGANGEWLDFVVQNRKSLPIERAYDLVIGPVANDATLPVIDDYIVGVYTKDEAVKRLLPQNLTDQYAFLTPKSLALLTFQQAVKYE